MEEHEVIEAMSLMHLKMPAKMRAKYEKRLEFIATQANAGATGKRDRGTNSLVDDANDPFAFDDQDPEMNKKVKR